MQDDSGFIKDALNNIDVKDASFTEGTDLVEAGILDSLDSAMFFVELEVLSGINIPQVDVEEKKLLKVSNLLEYFDDKKS